MKTLYQLATILLLLFVAGSGVYAQVAPYAPSPKVVSINPATNDVIMKWHIMPSPTATISYLVTRKLENPRIQPLPTSHPIGTNVPFPDSTVIIPYSAGTDVDKDQQAFCLTANTSAVLASKLSDYHFTIFLTTDIDTCSAQTVLKWTKYRATDSELKEENSYHKLFNSSIEYEVWGYPGNPPFNQASAVKLSEKSQDTIFRSKTLEKGKNYYFFVKAYLPEGNYLQYGPEISYSNRDSAIYQRLAIPMFINITQVEAKDNSIELKFAIDPKSELQEYCIERTTDPSQAFEVIHNFSSKTTTTYTDSDVDTNQRYYYRVSAIRCNALIKHSNIAASILLSSEFQPYDTQLQWSPSVSPGSTYSITRTIPDNTLVASNISDINYTDNVLHLIQQGYDRFCYQVAENAAGGYTSTSKPSCFVVESSVYMPDAIDPTNVIVNATTGMQRNRFGPVIDMSDTMYGYELTIFNRWGKKVFETTKKIGEPLSANHLWDGHYKNKLVEPGLYLYTITVYFTNSSTSQKGNVSVFY